MAKKDKTAKLPKKVGGVKVPKQLRKTARTAIELAQNPLAREIVSAAVVAGVAALAKGKTGKAVKAASAAAPETADKLADLGSLISQSVAAFVNGFGKGADLMSSNSTPKPKDAPQTEDGPKRKA